MQKLPGLPTLRVLDDRSRTLAAGADDHRRNAGKGGGVPLLLRSSHENSFLGYAACRARLCMVEELHTLRQCVCSVLIRLIDSDDARPGR
jgi:hypothetical protein